MSGPILRSSLVASLLALACAPTWCPAQAPIRPPEDPAGLAPVQADQKLTVNAYLGTINGEPFFVEDVLRPLDAELRRLTRVSKSLTDFRLDAQDAIRRQIETHISGMLVDKAAKDALGDDDQKKVDMFMTIERKKLPTEYEGSQARADQILRARGSSFEQELEDRKRHLIRELYLRKILFPRIVITRKQLLEEYDRTRDKYTIPGEVELFTITLPISRWLQEKGPDGAVTTMRNPTAEQLKTATDAALALARKAVAEVRADPRDETFADKATSSEYDSADGKRDQGGRWPHTRKGMLRWTQVEAAAFALPKNSVADPVIVPDAENPVKTLVVVVKVGDVTPGRTIGFTEAQADIEKRLRETQWVTLTNEYFRKLKENANIEGVDKMVETVTETAVARYAVK